MSELKATPGPYRVIENGPEAEAEGWQIFGQSDDEWVADCGWGGNSKECANFLAASWDLYHALLPFAALAALLDHYRHEDDSTCEWRIKASDIRAAQKALAKARGEK